MSATCDNTRTEWLEMKTLFKKMQKDQMKKVKVDNRKVISNGGGGGGNDLDKKKFVQNCLVKVTCSEQCTATVQQIKVTVTVSLCHCSLSTAGALFEVRTSCFCGFEGQ